MTGAVLAGLAAGLLTGAGIGGGTLLLVYLTNLGGMELRQAQGVNLIYFLITAPPALWGHFKQELVDKPLALRAGAAGLVAAGLTAWLTQGAGHRPAEAGLWGIHRRGGPAGAVLQKRRLSDQPSFLIYRVRMPRTRF